MRSPWSDSGLEHFRGLTEVASAEVAWAELKYLESGAKRTDLETGETASKQSSEAALSPVGHRLAATTGEMHPNPAINPLDRPQTGDVTQKHVRRIAEIEEAARNERSLADRLVDGLAALVGNVYFFLIHAVGIALWILLNSGVIQGIEPFDPYPWRTLLTVLPLEGLLISFTVLMIQQRMANQIQQRAQLELQISLLAEAESTKALEMLRALCAHHGLKEAEDPETVQLIRPTEAGKVMKEVERELTGK